MCMPQQTPVCASVRPSNLRPSNRVTALIYSNYIILFEFNFLCYNWIRLAEIPDSGDFCPIKGYWLPAMLYEGERRVRAYLSCTQPIIASFGMQACHVIGCCKCFANKHLLEVSKVIVEDIFSFTCVTFRGSLHPVDLRVNSALVRPFVAHTRNLFQLHHPAILLCLTCDLLAAEWMKGRSQSSYILRPSIANASGQKNDQTQIDWKNWRGIRNQRSNRSLTLTEERTAQKTVKLGQ